MASHFTTRRGILRRSPLIFREPFPNAAKFREIRYPNIAGFITILSQCQIDLRTTALIQLKIIVRWNPIPLYIEK